MKVVDLKDKKILVLGLGREGLSTLKYLSKHLPGQKISIADQAEKKVDLLNIDKEFFGPSYLDNVNQFDVIIKAPGITPHLSEIKKFKMNGGIISSATQIFFGECPGKIIGITGTKGKSTTTSLIYQVLKTGGLKVELVGNLGIPALDYLDKGDKDTIFVFELSSHQLYDLNESPDIAVMTNIYPEHLDYYKDFKEYIEAKTNITRFQTDKEYFIFNQDSEQLVGISTLTKAVLLPFSDQKHQDSICYIDKDWIIYKGQKIIKLEDSPLVGRFNALNIMPSIIIGKLQNISSDIILKAIQNFKPLPHRLEFVTEKKGIKFYNDSLATVPQTTAEALGALGDAVETLIAGGFDRGIDMTLLGPVIANSKIKNLILFPTTGEKIWQAVSSQDIKSQITKYDVSSMDEAVKIAFGKTSAGKICLLSPAATSFGIFKDYADRGDQFKKSVLGFTD